MAEKRIEGWIDSACASEWIRGETSLHAEFTDSASWAKDSSCYRRATLIIHDAESEEAPDGE